MAARKQKPEKDILFVNKVEMIPIENLIDWERNPRNNENAIAPLANSIKHFGMLVPILVNEKNEVIAGNTRLKACRELKLTKVPCVRAEHLTPEQQVAFNIADNKLSEIATWDQDMLKDILFDVQKNYDEKFDPMLIGFQQAEVDLIFKGWESNAARITDVKSENTIAPSKIIIECKPEHEESLRMSLQEFLSDTGLEEVKIR